jgi:hypothetical protein
MSIINSVKKIANDIMMRKELELCGAQNTGIELIIHEML